MASINKDPKEMAEEMSNFVNTYSFESKIQEFAKEMSRQHRTLQQSFTRLCLVWLEHVAKDEYGTDPRNENSKRVAKDLIEAFKKEKGQDFNPSEYLGFV